MTSTSQQLREAERDLFEVALRKIAGGTWNVPGGQRLTAIQYASQVLKHVEQQRKAPTEATVV